MSRTSEPVQGQVPTSTSSEHGEGQLSKVKRAAKARARSLRPEEERFNIALKPTTSRNAGRAGGRRHTQRAGRMDRLVPWSGNYDTDVPNYPPPSFQEAMSTPPVSCCPSTVALVPSPMASLPPLVIPGGPIAASNSTPLDSAATETGRHSDSDESMVMIGRNEAESPQWGPGPDERTRRKTHSQPSVPFPRPAQERDADLSSQYSSQRGRSVLDLAAIFDGTEPAPPRTPSTASPTSSSKRFISLSPLRTMFPSRTLPPIPPDRPHSAHPTPGTSPYSNPGRNASSFFRSTTSLASVSFLRLPLTSGQLHGRSDSFLARRFLSGKGKDRTGSPPPEALDANWHEVDEVDLAVEDQGEVEEEHPPSLMTVVESVTNPICVTSSRSPTTSVSFALGPKLTTKEVVVPVTPPPKRSTTPASVGTPSPAPTSTETPPTPQPAVSSNTVHPLSLRDRKPPIQRSPRKKTPRTPPIYVPPPPTDPIITTVRTRMSPPPLQQPQTPPGKMNATVGRPSPLRMESSSSHKQTEDVAVAVAAPIPIHAPVPARPIQDGVFICRCGSPEEPPNPVLSRTPSPLSPAESLSRSKHYSGRPLPRTPTRSRAHVDSTFAPHEDICETPVREVKPTNCPEGLLIDLGDTLADTGTMNALSHRGDARPPSPPPLIDLNSSVEDIPAHTMATPPRTQVTGDSVTAASTVPGAFSEITDLDLLTSSLADGMRIGSGDHDALRAITEFIGPAVLPLPRPASRTERLPIPNSGNHQNQNPSSSQSHRGEATPRSPAAAIPSPTPRGENNISLVGRVELVRKRITKEGRVKLKLTLCGLAVDKCGICLSQFKVDQMGCLTSECRHTYHDRCLAMWLVRSRSCPLCRVPLDLDT